jgi:hypothetical protein
VPPGAPGRPQQDFRDRPAAHDTGSAIVAVPTTTEHFAYLSSGTWSLLGLELSAPVITEQRMRPT